MKTLRLTAKDFKQSNSYWKDYIGVEIESGADVNVEIEANLGYVRFDHLNVKGYILAEAGTGIGAGWSIKAGEGIKAGWSIEAGEGIKAGEGIEAGEGIKAGWSIEAGWSIKAGTSIKAGWGIKAGLSISCKLTLKVAYKVFAGICFWRNQVDDSYKTITCGKFEGGEVEYGILKETGLPEETKQESMSGKMVKVVVDGKEYEATIK